MDNMYYKVTQRSGFWEFHISPFEDEVVSGSLYLKVLMGHEEVEALQLLSWYENVLRYNLKTVFSKLSFEELMCSCSYMCQAMNLIIQEIDPVMRKRRAFLRMERDFDDLLNEIYSRPAMKLRNSSE